MLTSEFQFTHGVTQPSGCALNVREKKSHSLSFSGLKPSAPLVNQNGPIQIENQFNQVRAALVALVSGTSTHCFSHGLCPHRVRHIIAECHTRVRAYVCVGCTNVGARVCVYVVGLSILWKDSGIRRECFMYNVLGPCMSMGILDLQQTAPR